MKRKRIEHIEEKKMSAYLDGELDQNQSREIEAHLETCEHCKGLVAELKKVGQDLQALRGLEPDEFFASRVKTAILRKHPRRTWRKVLLPVLASAAAVISIVAGGFIGQVMYAGTSQNGIYETELTSYLGTAPAQDFPEGSFGEVADEVLFEDLSGEDNGGNS